MKGYDDILLSTIPNLDTLDMWYENNWNEIMKKNNKLGNYYVPVLSTYAPNINFIIGHSYTLQQENSKLMFFFKFVWPFRK